MSLPTLTNAIIQPQNIILNQVPLTTVIPNVNTPVAVPIVAATPIEQTTVVETIPANLVPVQQNTNTIKQAVASQPSAPSAIDHTEVINMNILIINI